jgi:hypothetical protein
MQSGGADRLRRPRRGQRDRHTPDRGCSTPTGSAFEQPGHTPLHRGSSRGICRISHTRNWYTWPSIAECPHCCDGGGRSIRSVLQPDWIASRLPNLELARRLRYLATPRAFFVLFCSLAIIIWLLDFGSRVGATAVPGGSYQAPQQHGQAVPSVPTHARLRFPAGTTQTQAIGAQENIWSWNTIAAQSRLQSASAEMNTQVWIVVLVFSEPTEASQFYAKHPRSPSPWIQNEPCGSSLGDARVYR